MKYTAKFSVLLILILCFSCKKEDGVEPNENSVLTLIKSENKVLRNQEITFQLMDEQTDITQAATFYVNDAIINGNVFSSSVDGSFQVYADYNGNGEKISTQIDSFEVYIPRKKILIEGFTGTWCGWCPRLKTGVKTARESIDDLVVVAIHGDRGVPGRLDPYTTVEGMFLFDYLEIFGFPWALINRNVDWTHPGSEDFPLEDLYPFEGIETDISIAIDSELSGNNLSVAVKIISEDQISNEKLVVFLLEDGLMYDQTNYYNNNFPGNPFYGLGDPLVNFVHDDVLRISITDPLGESIPITSALTEYIKNFTVNIPSEFNASRLKLVAIIFDDNNVAINVQQAPINQFQDFE